MAAAAGRFIRFHARSAMRILWEKIKAGFVRLVDPTADFLVRRGVSPNAITTVGTASAAAAGVVYALGHIRTAGFILAATAFLDIMDGQVARRSGRSTTFGAFYDSSLDRVADGALMGGLTVFYATSAAYGSVAMMVVALVGLIGTFLISYTRARAESLGIDAKVGVMQRPERIVLLSAPQALFGLALNGAVLRVIVIVIAATAWITAVQRIRYVYRVTTARNETPPIRVLTDTQIGAAKIRSRRAQP
ncbi:MAG TPA: CDP-alcohol phosphatidyltransferase family protein [Gemmatimonadaceae bacterium]|nr:CDP-alcohol phosphatidyltransferase family protein [Gemmatimonadaceae bacterium]